MKAAVLLRCLIPLKASSFAIEAMEKNKDMKKYTQILADFVHSLTFESLASKVVEKTKECILDTVGCALAGSVSRESKAMIKAIMAYDEGVESVVWGTRIRSSVFSSCLMNGTMSHCLEMDDVHRQAKVHAGAVVIPTLLVLGGKLSSGGESIILGTVLGYEIAIRVGITLGAKAHRMRGWHATGTCGVLGAAAGSSKLLGLNSELTANALGLAGTQSSGLWAFTADGSMSKRFHSGRAAQSGMYAGVLAQGGFTGPKMILEAEDGGFFRAFSDKFDLDSVVEALGERFAILEVSVKPYPCCRTLHGPLEAILKLRAKEHLRPQEIKRISVRTYEVAIHQCGYTHRPNTAVDAQFSMPYALSVALFDGEAGYQQFSADRIRDEEVLGLARKVEMVVDEELDRLYPSKWCFILEIETLSGTRYTQRIDSAKGDPDHPLSAMELENKFMNNATPIIGEKKSKRLVDMILDLERLNDINQVIELFVPEAID
jgi:2-methylcitrate dehydratase PrpD